jgi:hypothetical protein
MIKCLCGKEIASVPNWLRDVKVQFVCNNCPNREVQGITQVDLTGGKVEEEVAKKVVDTMPEAEDDDDEFESEAEEKAVPPA